MWQLDYEAQASKFLSKADKQTQVKILKYLTKAAQSPKSFGSALTGGLRGLWRYRIEGYRVICELREQQLVVLVIDIGHRSAIYKNR